MNLLSSLEQPWQEPRKPQQKGLDKLNDFGDNKKKKDNFSLSVFSDDFEK